MTVTASSSQGFNPTVGQSKSCLKAASSEQKLSRNIHFEKNNPQKELQNITSTVQFFDVESRQFINSTDFGFHEIKGDRKFRSTAAENKRSSLHLAKKISCIFANHLIEKDKASLKVIGAKLDKYLFCNKSQLAKAVEQLSLQYEDLTACYEKLKQLKLSGEEETEALALLRQQVRIEVPKNLGEIYSFNTRMQESQDSYWFFVVAVAFLAFLYIGVKG